MKREVSESSAFLPQEQNDTNKQKVRIRTETFFTQIPPEMIYQNSVITGFIFLPVSRPKKYLKNAGIFSDVLNSFPLIVKRSFAC